MPMYRSMTHNICCSTVQDTQIHNVVISSSWYI